MSTEEKVLGVITNATLRAGFMGVKSRSQCVIITDRRILFARQTVASMKGISPDTTVLAQAQAAGHTYATLIQRYMTMTPDAVLVEHPDNFAIDRSTVSKVKIKTSSGGESGVSTDTLVIKTTDKTHKLTLLSADQARSVLTQTGLLPS